MTSRQVYEATLIECNQTSATSLLLEDYNYLINKAIYQYIDKRYNLYDINQQLSDDLRVLKSTCILTPTLSDDYPTNSIFGATYEVNLPDDYFHVLNCICEYNIIKQFKCYDANSR